MVQCERFFGSDWFYNPSRWRTADGHVPYRTLWAYWYGMEPMMALERITAIRSLTTALRAMRDPQGAARAVEKEEQLALPE